MAFMSLGRRPMVVSPAPQEVELGSAYLRKHYGPRATVGGARECLSSQALWRRVGGMHSETRLTEDTNLLFIGQRTAAMLLFSDKLFDRPRRLFFDNRHCFGCALFFIQ